MTKTDQEPLCPCAGRCHHAESPCSLGCWAAQKPWRVEEAVEAERAATKPNDLCEREGCTSGCHSDECEHHGYAPSHSVEAVPGLRERISDARLALLDKPDVDRALDILEGVLAALSRSTPEPTDNRGELDGEEWGSDDQD